MAGYVGDWADWQGPLAPLMVALAEASRLSPNTLDWELIGAGGTSMQMVVTKAARDIERELLNERAKAALAPKKNPR
ncbi:MAG: hypothetical protein GY719_08050 [bacterium]|nr:hypothetical protein [bacterium]